MQSNQRRTGNQHHEDRRQEKSPQGHKSCSACNQIIWFFGVVATNKHVEEIHRQEMSFLLDRHFWKCISSFYNFQIVNTF